MRPSEGLALETFQTLPPINGIPGAAGKWPLLIRASEPRQPGKTGDSFARVSAWRRDPGLHERHSGLPETALEDPVNPFEDPVNSLHYPVSSLGGPT